MTRRLTPAATPADIAIARCWSEWIAERLIQNNQRVTTHQGEEIPVNGIDNKQMQPWLESINAFLLRTFETPHYHLKVYTSGTRQFTVREWKVAETFEVFVPVSLIAAELYINGMKRREN